MKTLPQQRCYYDADEPGTALCCGAAFTGDLIAGQPCPACGKSLPYRCDHCGDKAACYGTYEGHTGYSCDECCGHGCEDGHCDPISDKTETRNAGDFNDEDAITENDKYDKRKIRVPCPHCRRVSSPLCSPKTKETSSGMRWVGCDHQEPYASFKTTCRCGGNYIFTVHTPQ